jgi:toxin ParE1/3/4
LILHPEALIELEEQAAWYETRREGLGSELLAEVRGTLQRLEKQPLLGAPVLRAAPARRVWLASFPLSVVYFSEQNTLFVVAVAHAKRRPGYWRDRL